MTLEGKGEYCCDNCGATYDIQDMEWTKPVVPVMATTKITKITKMKDVCFTVNIASGNKNPETIKSLSIHTIPARHSIVEINPVTSNGKILSGIDMPVETMDLIAEHWQSRRAKSIKI